MAIIGRLSMHTANIQLGEDVEIGASSIFNFVRFGDHVKIGKDSYICGGEDHLLEIGSGSNLNHHTVVDGAKAKITIGENVSFAAQNVIVADWQLIPGSKLAKLFPKPAAPITIGSHSWIGFSCVIAPGVTIGEFCVIAANSYVDEDVPPYSIYGGNPARLIKKLDPGEIG